jgi:hypothetical protein
MPKLRCVKIGHRMIRRSHFCEHRMNSWEEKNKCISTGWSGGTIGWLRRFILCFFGKHTERHSRRNGYHRMNRPDAQKMLKCPWFYQNLVENFISFPTSTRSPKTEFGAKSYGQNTEGHRHMWQDEPLLLSVQLRSSDAQKLVKCSGFFRILFIIS